MTAVIQPLTVDDVDVEFVQQPACQCSSWFTSGWQIFGWNVRRGRKLLSKERDCPNTAVWMGLRRCCHKTILVCEACRQLTKHTLGCTLCNRFEKSPRWRML